MAQNYELAQAWVAVLPSFKGFRSTLNKTLGKEISRASKSISKSFSQGLDEGVTGFIKKNKLANGLTTMLSKSNFSDSMSTLLRKGTDGLGDMINRQGDRGFRSMFSSARGHLQNFASGPAWGAIQKSAQFYVQGMKQAFQIGTNLSGALAKAGGNFAKSVGGLAGSALGVAGVGAGVVLGKGMMSGLQRAIDINSAEARLRGIGYQGKILQQIMSDVQRTVDGAPATFPEMLGAAQKFLSSGVQVGGQLNKLMGTTIALAVQSGRTIEDLIPTLSQIAAAGKAQLQDLRQLEERGIPILQYLGKSMGKTRAEILDMVSTGAIPSNTVFDSLAENAADVNEVLKTDLVSNINILKARIAKVFEPFWLPIVNNLVPVVMKINELLGSLKDNINFDPITTRIKKLGDSMIELLDKTKDAKGELDAGPWAKKINDMIAKAMTIGKLDNTTKGGLLGGLGLIAQQIPILGGLFKGINPLTVGFVGAIYDMYQASAKLRNSFDDLKSDLSGYFEKLWIGMIGGTEGEKIAPFKKMGDRLAGVLDSIRGKFAEFEAWSLEADLGGKIGAVLESVWTFIESFASTITDNLPKLEEAFLTVWNALAKAFGGGKEDSAANTQSLKDTAAKFAETLVAAIGIMSKVVASTIFILSTVTKALVDFSQTDFAKGMVLFIKSAFVWFQDNTDSLKKILGLIAGIYVGAKVFKALVSVGKFISAVTVFLKALGIGAGPSLGAKAMIAMKGIATNIKPITTSFLQIVAGVTLMGIAVMGSLKVLTWMGELTNFNESMQILFAGLGKFTKKAFNNPEILVGMAAAAGIIGGAAIMLKTSMFAGLTGLASGLGAIIKPITMTAAYSAVIIAIMTTMIISLQAVVLLISEFNKKIDWKYVSAPFKKIADNPKLLGVIAIGIGIMAGAIMAANAAMPTLVAGLTGLATGLTSAAGPLAIVAVATAAIMVGLAALGKLADMMNLDKQIKSLSDSIVALIDGLFAIFTTSIDNQVDFVISIGDRVAAGINRWWPLVQPALQGFTDLVVGSFTAMANVVVPIATSIVSIMPELIDSMAGLADSMSNGFVKFVKTLAEYGVSAGAGALALGTGLAAMATAMATSGLFTSLAGAASKGIDKLAGNEDRMSQILKLAESLSKAADLFKNMSDWTHHLESAVVFGSDLAISMITGFNSQQAMMNQSVLTAVMTSMQEAQNYLDTNPLQVRFDTDDLNLQGGASGPFGVQNTTNNNFNTNINNSNNLRALLRGI